jgi:hypothetical protein
MNNSELLERFRELEARLQKVNTELDGLRVAIKGRTFTEMPKKVYEVGEYVRVKPYGDTDEFVGMIAERIETPKGLFYFIYDKDKNAIFLAAGMIEKIEKWEPKKGDLCIFWDYNLAYNRVVRLFGCKTLSLYRDYEGACWVNCIPFISEKQFKEHIGYEN